MPKFGIHEHVSGKWYSHRALKRAAIVIQVFVMLIHCDKQLKIWGPFYTALTLKRLFSTKFKEGICDKTCGLNCGKAVALA